VIAAHAVSEGASFLEVFHRLRERHRIGKRAAFLTTVRAVRGGGMTKDLVYLRGLREVIEYVRSGAPLERLYTGRVALRHVDSVAALVERGLVAPPRVVPMVLRDERCKAQLAAIRESEDATSVVARMAEQGTGLLHAGGSAA
jgi:hypothetical protein